MNSAARTKRLREIEDALKEMGELVKEKERAYAEGDVEAIRRIKERENKLGAVSLEIGRRWAKKNGDGDKK